MGVRSRTRSLPLFFFDVNDTPLWSATVRHSTLGAISPTGELL